MVLFDYIGKMALVSGVLYAYYHWVLRDNRFHQWNRFYLLAAVFLSLTLPLFHISLERQTTTDNKLLAAVYALLDQQGKGAPTAVANAHVAMNGQVVLMGIYICISALLLMLFCIRLLHLNKLSRRSPHIHLDDFTLVRTAAQGSPFSFFRWIFWDDNLELDSPEGRRILRHELTHVHQRHSIDKVLMQLILVLFFPIVFFYLIRRELQIIHEYLADKEATKNEDLEAYALMLVSEVFQAGPYAFANRFFQHPVRRRIAMMTRFTHPRFTYVRKLMFLPLSLVLFCLLAFRVEQKYPGISIQIQKEIKLTGIDLSSLTRVSPPTPQPPTVKVPTLKPHVLPAQETAQRLETVQVVDPPQVQVQIAKPLSLTFTGNKGYMDGGPYRVGYGNQDDIQDPSIAENPTPMESVTVVGFSTSNRPGSFIRVRRGNPLTIDSAKYGEAPWKAQAPRFDSIQFIVDGRVLEAYPSDLNANSIQSMTVIKGNQDLIKIYGYKASHGVILIKTKPEGTSATGTVVQFDSSDNKIFTKVEIEASFPGGSNAWSNYVRNIITHHIDELQQDGQSGTCEIQFVVGKDGSISDVQALTMKGSILAKLSAEAVAKGPKWNPGIQNGRMVTSFRQQKITFQMPAE